MVAQEAPLRRSSATISLAGSNAWNLCIVRAAYPLTTVRNSFGSNGVIALQNGCEARSRDGQALGADGAVTAVETVAWLGWGEHTVVAKPWSWREQGRGRGRVAAAVEVMLHAMAWSQQGRGEAEVAKSFRKEGVRLALSKCRVSCDLRQGGVSRGISTRVHYQGSLGWTNAEALNISGTEDRAAK